MRERLWSEMDGFGDAPQPIRPQTMRDLHETLGVAGAPQDVRDAAIREWLKTNKPTLMMEYCLVDAGYLDHMTYGV